MLLKWTLFSLEDVDHRNGTYNIWMCHFSMDDFSCSFICGHQHYFYAFCPERHTRIEKNRGQL